MNANPEDVTCFDDCAKALADLAKQEQELKGKLKPLLQEKENAQEKVDSEQRRLQDCDKQAEDVRNARVSVADEIKEMSKKQLNEIKALRKPPAPIRRTLEAVYLLLQHGKFKGATKLPADCAGDWAKITKVVTQDDFAAQVMEFRTEALRDSPEVALAVCNRYLGGYDLLAGETKAADAKPADTGCTLPPLGSPAKPAGKAKPKAARRTSTGTMSRTTSNARGGSEASTEPLEAETVKFANKSCGFLVEWLYAIGREYCVLEVIEKRRRVAQAAKEEAEGEVQVVVERSAELVKQLELMAKKRALFEAQLQALEMERREAAQAQKKLRRLMQLEDPKGDHFGKGAHGVQLPQVDAGPRGPSNLTLGDVLNVLRPRDGPSPKQAAQEAPPRPRPKAPPARAASPEASVDDVMEHVHRDFSTHRLDFEHNQSAVDSGNPKVASVLAKVGESCLRYKQVTVRVEGYGESSEDKGIDEARAEAVAGWLKETGVTLRRLRPQGRGLQSSKHNRFVGFSVVRKIVVTGSTEHPGCEFAPPGIYFKPSSAQVESLFQKMLVKAAKLLRTEEHRGLELEIEGHTQADEDEEWGARRAEAVAVELQSAGVPAAKLSVVACGAKFKFSGSKPEVLQKCRRVELRIKE
mmetsp:Transcript_40577/g.106598  ORF Transcript_40577/g.106598 Transcript_40577/m.106598 type:complete len:638 (+) Transcript_40577:46-1959(+)